MKEAGEEAKLPYPVLSLMEPPQEPSSEQLRAAFGALSDSFRFHSGRFVMIPGADWSERHDWLALQDASYAFDALEINSPYRLKAGVESEQFVSGEVYTLHSKRAFPIALFVEGRSKQLRQKRPGALLVKVGVGGGGGSEGKADDGGGGDIPLAPPQAPTKADLVARAKAVRTEHAASWDRDCAVALGRLLRAGAEFELKVSRGGCC